ncbi:DUF3313 domain-containing protein [Desulfovibrio sp.]
MRNLARLVFPILTLCLLLNSCGGKSSNDDDMARTAEAGFLGAEESLLAPVKGHEPMRAWRNPDFNPKKYKAIIVDPVQVWNLDDMATESGIKPDELKALAGFFQNALAKALTDIKFPLADKPGPGVLRISAAVTNVRPSNPVRNSISSVLPVGILLSLGERAAIGRDPNVGGCSVAIRFSDAASGKTMGLFSDDRQGDKYDSANFSETGQAEKAMTDWAALIQRRILVLWGAKPVASK